MPMACVYLLLWPVLLDATLIPSQPSTPSLSLRILRTAYGISIRLSARLCLSFVSSVSALRCIHHDAAPFHCRFSRRYLFCE